MGDFNKIEGIHEIPIPGPVCPLCDGLKLTPNEGGEPVTCEVCEGTGYQKTDQTFRLRGRVRNIVKAEFEDWLEYRARRRVFDMRDKLDPIEFKESMAAVAEQCAAGTFSWGGTAWEVAMSHAMGQAKLYYFLMVDADRLDADKPHNRRQKYTDGDIIQWLARNEYMRIMLAQALKQIMDASPNFLNPPVRGVDD